MTDDFRNTDDREDAGDLEPGFEPRWKTRATAALRATARGIGRAWRLAAEAVRGDGASPLADVRAAFAHLHPRRIGLCLVGLLLAAYLLSGIYTVRPAEVAVVRRFGKVVAPRVTDGLHYRLPWPVERVDVVNVSEVRRETVGVTEPEPDHPLHAEGPGKLQVLSGDTNIVDYEVIAQYQVSDPAAYLFRVDYPPYQLIRDSVRAAVTRLSGATGVDAVLTTERQRLEEGIRREVQTDLDERGAGLSVVGVNLQKAYPPDEVAEAFRKVSSAREDKARTVNQAEGYRNSVVPEARGQSQGILAEARAYAQAEVDRARGASESFGAILAEYRTSGEIYGEQVTRLRLYLETMEKVLPQVATYVVQPGERVNLRLLANASPSRFPPVPGSK